MVPNILFFSRDYQSKFFPTIVSNKFQSLHVTLTKKEKYNVQKSGGVVVGCLEDELSNCKELDLEFPYLLSGFSADRFLNGFTQEIRISLIKKIAFFWSGIFDKYNPIAIVNEPIALEVSEILFIESAKRNIRYLALGSFYIPNTFYFLPNPEISSSYREIISSLNPSKGTEIASLQFSRIKNRIHPNYVNVLNKRKSVLQLIVLIKKLIIEISKRLYTNNKIIRKICYCDSSKIILNDIKTYFVALFTHESYYTNIHDLEAVDFYFFPIHFEPEAVISYGAYFHSEQDIFIHNLLKSLGENEVLVVKEHPQQLGVLTESRFKRLKSFWPNLFFVKGELSSFQFMDKAEAIITLGGTSGFEALVNGKNVINFGNNYYDSFQGVMNVSNFSDLRSFIRNKNVFPIKSDFYLYMSKIYSTIYSGDPWPNDNLFDDTNIRNITSAIESELSL